MTPTERAAAILYAEPVDRMLLCQEIAAAITEAVEEEREAIAKVVEGFKTATLPPKLHTAITEEEWIISHWGEALAKAIRERTT